MRRILASLAIGLALLGVQATQSQDDLAASDGGPQTGPEMLVVPTYGGGVSASLDRHALDLEAMPHVDHAPAIGETVDLARVVPAGERRSDPPYVRAGGRVFAVDADGRVVEEIGYAVPETALAYARHNPVEGMTEMVELHPGDRIGGDIDTHPVPQHPELEYFYLNGFPILVDAATRTVAWTV